MLQVLRIIIFCVLPLCCGAQTELLDSVTLATWQEYTDLEEALKNPDNVLKLNLRKSKLKEVPKEIYQFKNIQFLDLSRNKIKELPDSIVDTIKGFNMILEGKVDEYPEAAFNLVGTIEEAIEKGKKILAEAK